MRGLAKFFIILSMICCFWLIFPIILGAKALKKIDNHEMTTKWKVIVLLFVNVWAGIILLCIKDV